MPEPEPQTEETPPAGDSSHAPLPPAGKTTPPEPQAGDGQEPISLEEARKLRSEAQSLRKREKEVAAQLKVYQDKEQQARDAELSELDRTKKQVAELHAQHEATVQQLQTRIVRYAVEAEAHKLGIIDPEAAAKLLDWSELEYEDDGTPKNAKKLLETLVKHKPYLLAPQQQQSQQGMSQQQQQQSGMQQQGRQAPPIPAMNQAGRTSIPAPGQQQSQQPGQRFRPPKLSDAGVFVPPGTASQYQP